MNGLQFIALLIACAAIYRYAIHDKLTKDETMADWSKARLIASEYHSPGATGIGFAVFASTGEVTPELWDNIRYVERHADEDYAEGWAYDMHLLRALLEEDGITEPTED